MWIACEHSSENQKHFVLGVLTGVAHMALNVLFNLQKQFRVLCHAFVKHHRQLIQLRQDCVILIEILLKDLSYLSLNRGLRPCKLVEDISVVF